MKEIVIWAHSECRSTMSLFREVRRQAGVPVTIALWKYGEKDDVRRARESTGQDAGEYADLGLVPVGEDVEAGEALLARHSGSGAVHVFCVYQNSCAWRRLILKAKDIGLYVVIYAESPCEMCTGAKAIAKRAYYRFVLPFKVKAIARTADIFISQSGEMGTGRLLRLGWAQEKIVPFGYASEVDVGRAEHPKRAEGDPLRILHTGIEAKYRDAGTLLKAVDVLKRRGIAVEVMRTRGVAPPRELRRLYGWADVFVACGICEPWGMRVNDAIHAGLPAVVSDGMGASMIVERHGCGCVYRRRDARELADILERMATDFGFRVRISRAVDAAHAAWMPAAKAKEFLEVLRR